MNQYEMDNGWGGVTWGGVRVSVDVADDKHADIEAGGQILCLNINKILNNKEEENGVSRGEGNTV